MKNLKELKCIKSMMGTVLTEVKQTMSEMQVVRIKAKRAGADAFKNYNSACRRCSHYKRDGGIVEMADACLKGRVVYKEGRNL